MSNNTTISTASLAPYKNPVASDKYVTINTETVVNELQENTIGGGVQIGDMKRVPKTVNAPKMLFEVNTRLFNAVYEIAETGKLSPFVRKTRSVQLTDKAAN